MRLGSMLVVLLLAIALGSLGCSRQPPPPPEQPKAPEGEPAVKAPPPEPGKVLMK